MNKPLSEHPPYCVVYNILIPEFSTVLGEGSSSVHQTSDSQLGMILLSRGRWTLSGDISACPNWGGEEREGAVASSGERQGC